MSEALNQGFVPTEVSTQSHGTRGGPQAERLALVSAVEAIPGRELDSVQEIPEQVVAALAYLTECTKQEILDAGLGRDELFGFFEAVEERYVNAHSGRQARDAHQAKFSVLRAYYENLPTDKDQYQQLFLRQGYKKVQPEGAFINKTLAQVQTLLMTTKGGRARLLAVKQAVVQRSSPTSRVAAATSANGHEYREEVPEDLLDLYFDDFDRVKLLTKEEEIALARLIEIGKAAEALFREGVEECSATEVQMLEQCIAQGQEAKDHFVAANLRLVVSVVRQFKNRRGLKLSDLVQEGNVGLVQAVEKFDWRRGNKFSTYATYWIRQAIQRGISLQARTLRLPVAIHDALHRIHAAQTRLEAKTGQPPSLEEIAAATNLSSDRVRQALDVDLPMTSLDRRVGFDDEADTLGDLVVAANDSPEEEVVNSVAARELLDRARTVLDKRSWYVLTRRFELDGEERSSLDDLSKQLGISREWVRKIEKKALSRLKDIAADYSDILA